MTEARRQHNRQRDLLYARACGLSAWLPNKSIEGKP